MPTWLWDSEPMREALARFDVAAIVALLRAATGLSQNDFANLMGEGWSQSFVSNIERRRRNTLYDFREFLRFIDTVDMPRAALGPLVYGDPDATLEADNLCPTGASDVNRRSFNTLTAGLAAGAVLPPIRDPAQVGQAHVRFLWASLERLRRREESHGGGAIVGEAVRLFSRARAMLDESDYGERVGRELLAVAAEIGNAAGWAAFDQEDQALSRQLYSAAALLADDSGVPEIVVHLYTNLAHQSNILAYNRGRPGLAREALRFAGRAADAARYERSPRMHALIAERQAHAYAMLGDEHGFRGSITAARRQLDRGPDPADPQWSLYVTHSDITVGEAEGYEALARAQGESNGRTAALYQTVLDDKGLSPRERAAHQARFARALLAEGDRTQAIAEGETLLPDLGQRIVSARTLNWLRPVRTAAEEAGAEEFCARFDATARTLEDAA